MAHFAIEISAFSQKPSVDFDIHTIADIIASADGKLVDFYANTITEVLGLIVEAESELIVADLLESNMFGIEQIRHIFLLEPSDGGRGRQTGQEFDYTGFFSDRDLHNTIAIEIYPH